MPVERALTLAAVSLAGLVLLRAEATRVLHGASREPLRVIAPARLAGAGGAEAERTLAIGFDRSRRYLYGVRPDGRIGVLRLADGVLVAEPPIPGLEGVSPTAAARAGTAGAVVVASSDGRASIAALDGPDLRELWHTTLDDARRPVRDVCARHGPGRSVIAGVVGRDELAVAWRDTRGVAHARLRALNGEPLTHVAISGAALLVAGTQYGSVYCWSLDPMPHLLDVRAVGLRGVTALAWLGDETLLVGDAGGVVSAWRRGANGRLARARGYAPQPGAIRAIGPVDRARFVSAAAGGSLFLRLSTRERALASFDGRGGELKDLMGAAGDDGGVYALRDDGAVERYELSSAAD